MMVSSLKMGMLLHSLLLMWLLGDLVGAQNCTDATQNVSLSTTQLYVLFRRCTVNGTTPVNSNVTTTAIIEYCAFTSITPAKTLWVPLRGAGDKYSDMRDIRRNEIP